MRKRISITALLGLIAAAAALILSLAGLWLTRPGTARLGRVDRGANAKRIRVYLRTLERRALSSAQ